MTQEAGRGGNDKRMFSPQAAEDRSSIDGARQSAKTSASRAVDDSRIGLGRSQRKTTFLPKTKLGADMGTIE